MKFVICGKKEAYWKYLDEKLIVDGKHACYASRAKVMDDVVAGDTVVLLSGWWGRSWSENVVKNIINDGHPDITFEYYDGLHGQQVRDALLKKTQTDCFDRFEIMDLEE